LRSRHGQDAGAFFKNEEDSYDENIIENPKYNHYIDDINLRKDGELEEDIVLWNEISLPMRTDSDAVLIENETNSPL